MSADLVIVALAAGIGTYLFRFVPTQLRRREGDGGRLGRFFAATGPAAIATLFAVSVLPALTPMDTTAVTTIVGCAATIAIFLVRRNVALATIGGAVVYGVVFAVMGG